MLACANLPTRIAAATQSRATCGCFCRHRTRRDAQEGAAHRRRVEVVDDDRCQQQRRRTHNRHDQAAKRGVVRIPQRTRAGAARAPSCSAGASLSGADSRDARPSVRGRVTQQAAVAAQQAQVQPAEARHAPATQAAHLWDSNQGGRYACRGGGRMSTWMDECLCACCVCACARMCMCACA